MAGQVKPIPVPVILAAVNGDSCSSTRTATPKRRLAMKACSRGL